MKKVGEVLLRKSEIMELMIYIGNRAREGNIKEIRDFAPGMYLSDIIIKEREE